MKIVSSNSDAINSLFALPYLLPSCNKIYRDMKNLSPGAMLLRLLFVFSFTQVHGLSSIICASIASCTLYPVICISKDWESCQKGSHHSEHRSVWQVHGLVAQLSK